MERYVNPKNSTRYWKIQGWDNLNKLFEYKIKVGQITENKIKDLLQTLTARIALSEEETIYSYAKKGTRIYSDYLVVQNLEGNKYTLSCGSNPYVIAVIEDE
jgi:hypothetical protein